MDIYTFEHWQHDRDFKAEPGQEITPEIYNEFMNVTPPKDLPQETARQALRDHKIPVHAGFLAGEPTDSDSAGLLYRAFGMNDYGKGSRFFYLGLSHQQNQITDGFYYYMDCLNAFVNDGLFPAREFTDDADAIRTAADYEATLYKFEYRDGQRISSSVLYEPQFL